MSAFIKNVVQKYSSKEQTHPFYASPELWNRTWRVIIKVVYWGLDRKTKGLKSYQLDSQDHDSSLAVEMHKMLQTGIVFSINFLSLSLYLVLLNILSLCHHNSRCNKLQHWHLSTRCHDYSPFCVLQLNIINVVHIVSKVGDCRKKYTMNLQ